MERSNLAQNPFAKGFMSDERWLALPQANKEAALAAMEKYGDNRWWLSKDPVEIAKYQLFEDTLLVDFTVLHRGVNGLLGRLVLTPEFGSLNMEGLRKEAKEAIRRREELATFSGNVQEVIAQLRRSTAWDRTMHDFADWLSHNGYVTDYTDSLYMLKVSQERKPSALESIAAVLTGTRAGPVQESIGVIYPSKMGLLHSSMTDDDYSFAAHGFANIRKMTEIARELKRRFRVPIGRVYHGGCNGTEVMFDRIPSVTA
jgi:hypothetical protein